MISYRTGWWSLSRHLSLKMYQRLGFISAGVADVSVSTCNVSCQSLLHTHVANWYTYVCTVRHCKPVVNNHINMRRVNEHEI